VTVVLSRIDISEHVTLYGPHGSAGLALSAVTPTNKGGAELMRFTPTMWPLDERLFKHFCIEHICPIDAIPHERNPVHPAASCLMELVLETVGRMRKKGISATNTTNPTSSAGGSSSAPAVDNSPSMDNNAYASDAMEMNINDYGSLLQESDADNTPGVPDYNIVQFLSSLSVGASMECINMDGIMDLPRFTVGMGCALSNAASTPAQIQGLLTVLAARYGVDSPIGVAFNRLVADLAAPSVPMWNDATTIEMRKRLEHTEKQLDAVLESRKRVGFH
jgi:hypothetical protein